MSLSESTTYVIIIYALLVMILTLFESRLGLLMKGLVKMSAASTFLLLPLLETGHWSPFSILVFVALAASWVGDLCLVWTGTGPRFKLGILAFLVAHFAYAGAFCMASISWWVFFPLVLLLGTLGTVVFRRLKHEMPDALRVPVGIYIIALVAMTALAWSLDSPSGWRFGLAATSFLLSDIAVALQRFGEHSRKHRLWGVPLYFGAQLAFAVLISGQIT